MRNEVERKTKWAILLAACAFLLIVPVFLAVCALCLPEQYGETFLGELKVKYRRLEETPGKRIILAGGSGVAFGYDSAMLAEAFPEYEIVNLGMYAGLGTKMMLDLSEDAVHKGDIVIISPEQESQTLSDYFNGEYMWQAADGEFSLLWKVKRENWGQMLGTLPGFASEKLRYYLQGAAPEPQGVYRRASFNVYGDMESARCAQNIMPQGYDVNTPVRFTEEVLQEEFIEDLNGYASKLRKKGAQAWYRFCPVNAPAVEEGDIHAYYELLQEKLDFPIIGNPNDSVMESGWFYDTNFHLNSSGRAVNTIQCIRDIKAMQGDSAQVAYTMPKQPALQESAEAGGDSTDDARILRAEVYAGNRDIRKITIPEETELIEDGAFEGCTRLQAIILESEHPSQVRPGQEMLRGTDADIYVKDELLSDYRLDYFWSGYAERIHKQSLLKAAH